MSNQLFEAALGIKFPWFVKAVDFDAPQRRLTISVDFPRGSRFAHAQAPGQHPHPSPVGDWARKPTRTMSAGSQERVK